MNEISGAGTLAGRKGSLAVPGACADSYRIADMIIDNWKLLDEIIVTLDSHHVRVCLSFACLFVCLLIILCSCSYYCVIHM